MHFRYNPDLAGWQRQQLKLIPIQPLVIKELQKWNHLIKRAMKAMSFNGYYIDIYRDVPHAVFDEIVNITTSNMHCTTITETRAVVTISITSMDKLLMILNRMNTPKFIMSRSLFLQKSLGARGCCKVVCHEQRPFHISYRKNSERMALKLSYGHWNLTGVAQHNF